jgi:hypothetical protein
MASPFQRNDARAIAFGVPFAPPPRDRAPAVDLPTAGEYGAWALDATLGGAARIPFYARALPSAVQDTARAVPPSFPESLTPSWMGRAVGELGSQLERRYRESAPAPAAAVATHADAARAKDATLAPLEVLAPSPFDIGAMPFVKPAGRFAHLDASKVRGPEGLTPVFHGTPVAFDELDPSKAKRSLFGRGAGGYFTEDPEVTKGYSQIEGFEHGQRVIKHAHARLEELGARKAELADGMSEDRIKLVQSYRFQPYHLERMAKEDGNAPERYRKLADVLDDLETWEQERENLTRTLPQSNVRPAYLDIRNPFDMDEYIDPTGPDASRIADALNEAGYDGDYLLERLDGMEANGETPTGEALWKIGVNITNHEGRTLSSDDFNRQILQPLGYDGITHRGGGRVGRGERMHRVWIPFRTDQIHPAFDVAAEAKKASDGR